MNLLASGDTSATPPGHPRDTSRAITTRHMLLNTTPWKLVLVLLGCLRWPQQVQAEVNFDCDLVFITNKKNK